MDRLRNREFTFFSYLVLFLPLSVFSCATVKVPCTVMHPAEINMSRYKQVAIDEFRGNAGPDVRDLVKEHLINSGRLELVDRSHMDKVQRELSFAQTDATASTDKPELGKLAAVSAIIAGNINGDYDETMESSRGTCTRTDSNGKSYEVTCTSYTRKGKYRVGGNLDVIDVETGKTIKSKPLSALEEASESATDEQPDAIDRDRLYSVCVRQIADDFARTILPWSSTEEVAYKTCGDIPELERGIDKVKVGETDEAIGIFRTAAEDAEKNPEVKPDDIAIAYWDLALAYEYSLRFDESILALKKAQDLHPDDKFVEEIKTVKRRAAETKRLQEQQAAPSN